jgi:hypothetical protein
MIGSIRRITWAQGAVVRALWLELRLPVVVFLLLRIVTEVAVIIMLTNVPTGFPQWMTRNPSGPTYFQALPENPLNPLVEPWHRWDTTWYAKIAIQGYRADDAIAFPPLYPVLMRSVAAFTGGDYVLAALLVSNFAGLIAFILLYKLVQQEFGQDVANRTLIILALFPTAYYFVAGYTESLFLALVLGAWLAAANKMWVYAGVLCFFAALTRLQGAVLCFPMAWMAYIQLRERGFMRLLHRVPAVIGAPLGTASYLAFLAINNLGSLETVYARQWGLYTKMPWEAIESYFDRLSKGVTTGFENNSAVALLVFAILMLFVTFMPKFKMAYKLYVWATLGMVLLRYHENAAQFESVSRYVLVLFPCFIAAAMLMRRKWMIALYAIPAIYWGLFLLDRFVHWRWVA